jgi:hypothetical protein
MGNSIKILLSIVFYSVGLMVYAQTIRMKWKPIGPFETPKPDVDTGYVTPTGMGWIESVADAGNGVMFAGSNSGGLYKTEDLGKKWEFVPISSVTYGILDLKVFPELNQIWAATGTTVNAEPFGIGVMRSDDMGKTWNHTALKYVPHEKKAVWQFVVLNHKQEAIAAVTQNHIVYAEKGMDQPVERFGGEKYQFRQLIIHPREQKIWYASGNHLCISYNQGRDWVVVNEKLLANHQKNTEMPISRIAIALSPSNPDHVWAAYQLNYTNYIQLSRDKGNTWQIMGTNRAISRFDIHHAELMEDPNDSNILYAGAVRMYVSKDRGKTFNSVSNPAWATPSFMHDDIRSLEVTRNGDVLTGNDGGVSMSRDKGNSWQSLNGKGLTITQIYSMALHPKRKGDLIIGCQDLSTMKYFKGKWSNTSRLYGDGGPCLYRDGDVPWAIISQNAMLLASDNDGESWNSIGNPQITNKLYFPLLNDPFQKEVLYAGWYNLWRKSGDEWWENLSEKIDGGGFAIQAVTIANGKPFQGYLAYDQPAWKTGEELRGKLFSGKEVEGKIVWTDITKNLPILSWRYIRALATIPGDSLQIWAGLEGLGDSSQSNRLFYSSDGGTSWKDITKGLPVTSVNKIWVMQNRKTTVWASTDEGFWVYFDNLWNAAGKNLPKMIIKDFYLTDDQKEMYLATYGSGVWKAKIKRRYRK